jgi:hypothetical protein
MTQELIYQTLYSVLAVADSILQIWLTVTFAVLVAAYIAADRIGHYLYLLITFLYGLATLVLTIRFISAAYQIYYYRDLLVIKGYDQWPVPKVLSQLIGGGTLLLLVVGSIGTLWFVNIARRQSNRNMP